MLTGSLNTLKFPTGKIMIYVVIKKIPEIIFLTKTICVGVISFRTNMDLVKVCPSIHSIVINSKIKTPITILIS
jgi:hypothetical protein